MPYLSCCGFHIDRLGVNCRDGMMDQLERFLLVASGDEMAGALNSHEVQVCACHSGKAAVKACRLPPHRAPLQIPSNST